MVYDVADKAVARMNKRNLKAFDRLKLMASDELNLIRSVRAVYNEASRMAINEYVGIAVWAFAEAMVMAGTPRARAEALARRRMTRDWLMEYLEEVDPVMLCRFTTETERRSQRLAEAVEIEAVRQAEIELALRSWTAMIGQYAIGVVDRAMIDGFAAAGVRKVRWNTEKDERVCHVCQELDGKVFSVYHVPPKQHRNCRCWISPA